MLGRDRDYTLGRLCSARACERAHTLVRPLRAWFVPLGLSLFPEEPSCLWTGAQLALSLLALLKLTDLSSAEFPPLIGGAGFSL